MRIKYEDPRGMKLEVENPDDWIRDEICARIRAKDEKERYEFLEEVAVAIRTLQPGERKTLKSKPIEISIERTAEAHTEGKS